MDESRHRAASPPPRKADAEGAGPDVLEPAAVLRLRRLARILEELIEKVAAGPSADAKAGRRF